MIINIYTDNNDHSTCIINVPLGEGDPGAANICQHLMILRTFFRNLSKFITFAAAQLVLTPLVRNQGDAGAAGAVAVPAARSAYK